MISDAGQVLRSLGYRFVFDYKKDQLGVKESWQGFVQVEGEWYCPVIPRALIDATADYRAKRIDKATYDARIAERRTYRARPKERPDAEGYQRLQCPAAGTSPTARCDLKPRSVRTQTQGRLRFVLSAEIQSLPPACCTSESVTIAPESGAKFAQDLPFGSPEWHAAYSELRNANEGFNGYVKDPAHEALDIAGRRRVHGVAAQSVLVAFLIMAANVRKIRSFLEKKALSAGTLRRLPRRRRTKPLGDWRPTAPRMDPGSSPDPPSPA